jgi:MATE family multidrug resistance protein
MNHRIKHDEEDNASLHSSLSSTPTETTPLILNRLPSDKDEQSTWMSEFRWLIKNCIPIVFTFLMQNSLQMASIFTLGHLVNIQH